MNLYILKDSGIEGSNNSGRLLSDLIENCRIARLKDPVEVIDSFFSIEEGGDLIFDSVRLSKKTNLLEFLQYIIDTYKFYRFFKKNKFDCIIINNMLMINVLFAGIFSRRKVYVFSRENHMPKIILTFYSCLKKIFTFYVITNNQVFFRGCPGLCEYYLPNVIEGSSFKVRSNWPGGYIKFILAGAVYPLKNQMLIIKFVRYLKSIVSGIDFRIDVYGKIVDKNYYSGICKHIEVNDFHETICFHGEVDREFLRNKFSEADVFIQTSTSEGQSRALIEAIQAGLIPITTSAGDPHGLYDSECLVNLNSKSAEFDIEKLLHLLSHRSVYVPRLQSSLKSCSSISVVKEKLSEIMKS